MGKSIKEDEHKKVNWELFSRNLFQPGEKMLPCRVVERQALSKIDRPDGGRWSGAASEKDNAFYGQKNQDKELIWKDNSYALSRERETHSSSKNHH